MCPVREKEQNSLTFEEHNNARGKAYLWLRIMYGLYAVNISRSKDARPFLCKDISHNFPNILIRFIM